MWSGGCRDVTGRVLLNDKVWLNRVVGCTTCKEEARV